MHFGMVSGFGWRTGYGGWGLRECRAVDALLVYWKNSCWGGGGLVFIAECNYSSYILINF